MSDYGAIEGGTPKKCKAAEDETIEHERIHTVYGKQRAWNEWMHRMRRMRGYGAVEDGTGMPSYAWICIENA